MGKTLRFASNQRITCVVYGEILNVLLNIMVEYAAHTV